MKSRAMNSTPMITATSTSAKITQLSADQHRIALRHGAVVLSDPGTLGVHPHREREQRRQSGADQQAGDEDLEARRCS